MSKERSAFPSAQHSPAAEQSAHPHLQQAVSAHPQFPSSLSPPHSTPLLSPPSLPLTLLVSSTTASPACHTSHLEAGCADLLHQPLCQHLHCMRQGQAEAPTRICCPSRQHGVVRGLCALGCGLQTPTEQAPDLRRTHVHTCRCSGQPHKHFSTAQSSATHRAQPHTHLEPRHYQWTQGHNQNPNHGQ